MQSVKIIPSSSTAISSPPITSTTAATNNDSSLGSYQGNFVEHHLTSSTVSHHHHHHHHHHLSKTTNVGSLEQSIGVTSCSNVISNVSSSNQMSGAIGICATIAFMDIKSASKAHLAEHKFDDRILTTEYYEPTMQHGTATATTNALSHQQQQQPPQGEGCSLVINNKMMSGNNGNGSTSSSGCSSGENMSDMKQETSSHGRYASTSSHGLVEIKKKLNLNKKNQSSKNIHSEMREKNTFIVFSVDLNIHKYFFLYNCRIITVENNKIICMMRWEIFLINFIVSKSDLS